MSVKSIHEAPVQQRQGRPIVSILSEPWVNTGEDEDEDERDA
jgi:hypothetical protein